MRIRAQVHHRVKKCRSMEHRAMFGAQVMASWRVCLLQIVLRTRWKVICNYLLQHAKYNSIPRDFLYHMHVRFDESDRVGCYVLRRKTYVRSFVCWNLLCENIENIAQRLGLCPSLRKDSQCSRTSPQCFRDLCGSIRRSTIRRWCSPEAIENCDTNCELTQELTQRLASRT